MNNPFETIDSRLSNIENMLLELKQSPQKQTTAPADELLTVEDTAKFLSLSVPTVYGLISKKAIPVMKVSKRCYFSKSDLMEYLKAGRIRTSSEIEAEAVKHKSDKRSK